MKIHSVTILQITAAPGRLVDKAGNIYAGYALVEMSVTYDENRPRDIVRDILPFHTEGSLIGLPTEDNSYYLAHALGDDRPDFAEFVTTEPADDYA